LYAFAPSKTGAFHEQQFQFIVEQFFIKQFQQPAAPTK